mmetsp:Transcript_49353/g.152196  ORF Transcript_49353/g.152196 Transcript_49353/m.152196 type:complete len:307 (+) Transcript_49353:432-1352(+)
MLAGRPVGPLDEGRKGSLASPALPARGLQPVRLHAVEDGVPHGCNGHSRPAVLRTLRWTGRGAAVRVFVRLEVEDAPHLAHLQLCEPELHSARQTCLVEQKLHLLLHAQAENLEAPRGQAAAAHGICLEEEWAHVLLLFPGSWSKIEVPKRLRGLSQRKFAGTVLVKQEEGLHHILRNPALLLLSKTVHEIGEGEEVELRAVDLHRGPEVCLRETALAAPVGQEAHLLEQQQPLLLCQGLAPLLLVDVALEAVVQFHQMRSQYQEDLLLQRVFVLDIALAASQTPKHLLKAAHNYTSSNVQQYRSG